jgi:hypothetical protein
MKRQPITIKDAESLARDKVVALWPELARVTPSVSRRQYHVPSRETLNDLGVERLCRPPEGDEYIFTFAGQVETPDGHTLPRVARVIVNTQQGVVKTTVSR